jgi:isopentenyl phosphate kinase
VTSTANLDDVAIVKIGGSIATDRAAAGMVATVRLAALAAALCRSGRPLVLVHGTGHVGKPWAHRGGFAQSGVLPREAQEVALAIRSELRGLNQRVVAAMLAAGLPCIGVDYESLAAAPPAAAADRMRALLREGILPLTYGDMLLGADGSHRVVSSDAMLLALARLLAARTVIFLTDVDGVLDAAGARLPVVTRADLDSQVVAHRESDASDVSGGMRGKLAAAFEAARDGRECFVASGHDPRIVLALLRGEPAPATRVLDS